MRRRRIQAHYERRVKRDRPNYDILDWSCPEEQEMRFAVLARALREDGLVGPHAPRPFTVLDVGCGMADLRTYLHAHQPAARYVGVDIASKVLIEAKRRAPGAELAVADVFSAAPFPENTFDVVFCSGVFNLNVGNNEAFLRSGIPALFSLARHCLVVNFLHRRVPKRYSHCYYCTPETVMAVIPPSASSVRVLDDYLEKDFTVVARR